MFNIVKWSCLGRLGVECYGSVVKCPLQAGVFAHCSTEGDAVGSYGALGSRSLAGRGGLLSNGLLKITPASSLIQLSLPV